MFANRLKVLSYVPYVKVILLSPVFPLSSRSTFLFSVTASQIYARVWLLHLSETSSSLQYLTWLPVPSEASLPSAQSGDLSQFLSPCISVMVEARNEYCFLLLPLRPFHTRWKEWPRTTCCRVVDMLPVAPEMI